MLQPSCLGLSHSLTGFARGFPSLPVYAVFPGCQACETLWTARPFRWHSGLWRAGWPGIHVRTPTPFAFVNAPGIVHPPPHAMTGCTVAILEVSPPSCSPKGASCSSWLLN